MVGGRLILAQMVVNHYSVSDYRDLPCRPNQQWSSKMKRYKHWFWNSWFIDKVAHYIVKLNSYIWSKQYGKN